MTSHNNSALRLLVVLAIGVSWLTITNHCALGLMKPTAQAKRAHSGCCSGTTVPEKDAPHDGARDCCKSIHAVLPAAAAVTYGASTVQFELPLPAQWSAAQLSVPAGESFDHGPPRSLSFAERVLQRSLLSHAPPSAV